ncbi:DNA-binding protein [Lactobacillus johnsonii]|uniref:helix-turn-helix domain-containing protein n=1 Tax=Lactobacillus johnsonii TaxID=33959 RepID=UPI000BEEB7DD|nr:helix-turn-helix transcriptional regulator [Lactobacillus johnsonii]PEG67605.1 DNA-binding protein [Lactobacillus johnsonii]
MQIGKELKKLRLELGLSQTEMVGDILTKSYYSKIERGLHEINAKDLIEILKRNRVNISDFFQGIESKGKSKKYLEQLRNSYYEQNLSKIVEIRKICATDYQYRNVYAHAILLENFFKKNKLSCKEEAMIKKLILNIDEWGEDNLRLFAMAISLFDESEIEYELNMILRKYKEIDKASRKIQEILGGIMVNYLNIMFIKNDRNFEMIGKLRNFLYKLPVEPRTIFFKVMADYYGYLFNEEKLEAKKILDFFERHGMESITAYIAF